MDNNERRRRNTRKLIDEQFQGVAAQMAKAMKVSPGDLNRRLNPDQENARNIGDAFRQRIERASGVPEGWLDQDHDIEFVLGPHSQALAINYLRHMDPSTLPLLTEIVVMFSDAITEMGLEADDGVIDDLIGHYYAFCTASKTQPTQDGVKAAIKGKFRAA